MFWRTHAQRMLVEQGDTDVPPQLTALVQKQSVDELGLNPAAIHALWTMQGLGAIDGSNSEATEAALAALRHPSAGVRRAAVMVLPRNEATLNALLDHQLLGDADAQVRMATFLALAELPSREDAGAAVFAAINEARNADDRWLPDAATAAAAKNDTAFIKAMLTGPSAPSDLEGALGRVLKVVTTHYAGRGPTDSIVSTLTALKGAAPEAATMLLGIDLCRRPAFSLILIGDDYLLGALRLRSHRALYTRIACHHQLRPWGEEEIGSLLESSQQAVGLETNILHPAAQQLISNASNGMPRTALHLARAAWIAASEAKATAITSDHVQSVIPSIPVINEQ